MRGLSLQIEIFKGNSKPIERGIYPQINSSPLKIFALPPPTKSKEQKQIHSSLANLPLPRLLNGMRGSLKPRKQRSNIDTTTAINNNNMPKESKKVKIGQSSRHAPLGQVIQDDVNRGKYATSKRGPIGIHKHDDTNNDHEEELLDERTSKRILELGRLQQQEMMQEEEAEAARNILSSSGGKFGSSTNAKKQKQQMKQRVVDSSDEESDDEDFDEEELLVEEDDKGYVTMSDTIGLTADEEALLSNMMGGNDDDEMPERRNLADIIMSKIEEKEAAGVNMHQEGEEEEMMGMELPPKVVQVCCHEAFCILI